MGKVTKVEIVSGTGSAELSARIKKKGKKRFGKRIILKGKEKKNDR